MTSLTTSGQKLSWKTVDSDDGLVSNFCGVTFCSLTKQLVGFWFQRTTTSDTEISSHQTDRVVLFALQCCTTLIPASSILEKDSIQSKIIYQSVSNQGKALRKWRPMQTLKWNCCIMPRQFYVCKNITHPNLTRRNKANHRHLTHNDWLQSRYNTAETFAIRYKWRSYQTDIRE